LILRIPNGNGIGVLAGTIVCVAAVDVGGLVLGSSSGTSKMAPSISPNKTWEGLFGGVVFALIAGLAFGSMVAPWRNWKQGLLLGAVAAATSVIGDLGESKLKRDLGIKDMGTLLPGHGGVLDRFDGLLLALPAVYYLAVWLKLG
jgi:phosphatidate cytidylyltransferase